MGRNGQTVGFVLGKCWYRKSAAQFRCRLRRVSVGWKRDLFWNYRRAALFLGRRKRQTEIRIGRTSGHCRWTETERSHDLRQQCVVEILYECLLFGGWDLCLGGWKFQVCVYLRMLATDIVEAISGYLQSEFRRSLGQGTSRKKQHDTHCNNILLKKNDDRASEREFVNVFLSLLLLLQVHVCIIVVRYDCCIPINVCSNRSRFLRYRLG